MSAPANDQIATTTELAPTTSVGSVTKAVPKPDEPKKESKKIGLAFQGGGFPAGAVGAGVIKGLAEKGFFGPFPGLSQENWDKAQKYEIAAFSGTSAGALLATLCWAHAIKCKALHSEDESEEEKDDAASNLIKVAARHAMYYALGNNFAWFPIINANMARQLSTVDTQLRELQPEVLGVRPLGDLRPFDAFKQLVIAPWFQMLTRDWLRASLAAVLHPDDDLVDKWFENMDAFVGPSSPISPILEHRPTVPLIDVFVKPDIFYKTYQSWVPAVPELYDWIRARSWADLWAYNLRTMLHGDPVLELRNLAHRIEEKKRPRLAVGSSNIFSGDNKSFTEIDFLNGNGLDAIIASGSLETTNGWTIIKEGKNQGIYLDGAWADNPPLSEMVGEEDSDRPVHSLHEFWIVEYFPKYDANIPSTPLERQRRRDELWQNSLVEHEKKEIAQTQEQAARKHEQEAIKPCVRRIAHNFPIEPKASMVNNPLFLKTMMSHGYAAASCFIDNLD